MVGRFSPLGFMQYLLILALLLATFFVLFALQNAETVTIDLLFLKVQSSLAIVLLSALGSGVLIGLLGSSYNSFKKSLQIAQQNKQIQELQKTLNEKEMALKAQITEAKKIEETVTSESAKTSQ
ncbi:uncharacterized integral membrane protein [Pleurocapsa sp. PCC 7327]|uniref:LapA family protein n=1 Tax=Pleurocapsa sp. PCC 7327 TaxID=118163 RepID=UPI00029F9238|nr:LapA family protein [Pleurocapsa sp. PCC 7327]AFY77106.1 uncharacterized integral membrane protein [Pleurocapsa sp. PCC 7327]